MTDQEPCCDCGELADIDWLDHTGGQCVDCLLNYALPLTRIKRGSEQPQHNQHNHP